MKLFGKPFPIAVFGTLRSIPCDQGNSSLMFSKKPLSRKKCFIPHFLPKGIWLEFKENACGVAELFFYDPHDWAFILKKIDTLEGFSYSQSSYGYHRTLINVRLLPDDFGDDIYDQGLRLKERDFKIPRDEWNFPCIAAWVYSNLSANFSCKKTLNDQQNPIILD